MAYAAYRDHDVLESVSRPTHESRSRFQVLHFTVNCADAWRIRQAVARCQESGVVRCELLVHDSAAENARPRARLMIRLANASYPQVLSALLLAVPTGELGLVTSWPEHLRRIGMEASAP